MKVGQTHQRSLNFVKKISIKVTKKSNFNEKAQISQEFF
jgi:hypothetical protein